MKLVLVDGLEIINVKSVYLQSGYYYYTTMQCGEMKVIDPMLVQYIDVKGDYIHKT